MEQNRGNTASLPPLLLRLLSQLLGNCRDGEIGVATIHPGLVHHQGTAKTPRLEITSASELVTLFANLAQSEHCSIEDGIKLENE